MSATLLLLLAAACMLSAPCEGSKKERALFAKWERDPDVVKLESGVMYKLERKGEGLYHPMGDSKVTIHYHGINAFTGEVFGSSHLKEQSQEVYVNKVMPGWEKVMREMVEGDKVTALIPPALGFQDNGQYPSVGPGDTLITEIDMIKIWDWKLPISTCSPQTREDCSDRENAFLDKYKDPEAGKKELARLEGAYHKNLKTAVGDWMAERIRLLKSALGVDAGGGEEEEDMPEEPTWRFNGEGKAKRSAAAEEVVGEKEGKEAKDEL